MTFVLETKTDPGARMHIVGLGQLMHPGTCMVCGSGVRESGYLAVGVYFDYEGEMYICVEYCLPEIIKMIGGLTHDEAQLIVDAANRALEQAASLKADMERLNERLIHYDALLNSYAVNNVGASDLVSNADSEGNINPDPVVTVSDNGESESEESTQKRRPYDFERVAGSDGDKPEL